MGKQWELRTIDIYDKGDLKGYAAGYITFQYNNDEWDHEFLYRIDDNKNGDSHTLVSIDYGYRVPFIDNVWDYIETYLTRYILKRITAS